MLDIEGRTVFDDFELQFFGDPKAERRQLCFLMPTGLTVLLNVKVVDTFNQIKNQLWKEIENQPGYEMLQIPSRYAFNCYNQRFEKEEIFDESITLREKNIFRSMVLVVERVGDRDEKLLNMRIGSIICLPIFRITNMTGKEEKDFRRNIHSMCEEVVNLRKQETIEQRMNEVFPPSILDERVPLSTDLTSNMLKIKFLIYMGTRNVIIEEDGDVTPEAVLQNALNQWYKQKELKESEYDTNLYFLKVAGAEEYIYGQHQIMYFTYVQKCLGECKMVTLSCVKRAKLANSLKVDDFKRCSSLRTPETVQDVPYGVKDLWDIDGQFSITVGKAQNVLGEENAQYFVKLCLFHGGEPLVNEVVTQNRSPFPTSAPEWNEKMDFDISIRDLPRNVRLCCVLYNVKNSGRRRNYKPQSVAWVNIALFDYKGYLKCETARLNMWECFADDETFNHIGTTTTTTKTDSIILTLKFPPNISNVRYPSFERVCKLSASLALTLKKESEESIKKFGISKVKNNDQIVFGLSQITDPPKQYVDELWRIINKDPLEELFENDKTLLWQMRVYCNSNAKNSLPKLLRSFDWSDHTKVAMVKQLVRSWPKLEPEYALELLDYQYPDVDVRNFAVRCLEDMPDSQLGLYLLQLVQVLKYECYLNNKLTQFLLKRAIKNSRIGHYFFWHLRSEMHEKELTTRFGLILEAYCRSNVTRINQLYAQHQAIELFNSAAQRAKLEKKDGETTSSSLAAVRKILDNEDLEPFLSPSCPTVKISKIIPDKSKFMDSKKKPLWLYCKNDDALGGDIIEMYKSGDDLRQDMLTLQTIAIMNQLWLDNSMDLKLNVYGCISTGNMTGFLNAVSPSCTLSDIQRRFGGVLTDDSIYKWLKSHNKKDSELDEAIDNFTKSCAGYCVATYILGIGDRHSDNIMMTPNGKLFHIDFGHFLGNYKVYNVAGVIPFKRERVPMIMLSSFYYIITKGRKFPGMTKAREDARFKNFLEMCVKAFQIIRSKATLFINLFALMCSSGIPELSKLDDIEYLRNVLFLNDTDKNACKNFVKKLESALRNELSAQFNFWIHNKAH